ncbi:MAG: homocysteine S-methyltransferase family protein [Clostridiaceae bacterium]|nr:homocysteine S-methyltransferase family protein [Clostridiaceae bacterium]
MLQNNGMEPGELPESYNILKPEVMEKIHKEYIEAGSDIITTNTFGANSYKLQPFGYKVEDVVRSAVETAKRVAGDCLVALGIGPIGQLMEPYGTLSFQEAYSLFAQQVKVGSEAGADMILIETMSDLLEAKAAVLAAKENSNLPVICSMTFQEDGRTLTGTDRMTMVNVLEGLGVDALGINCSLGPKEVDQLMGDILKYATVPIILQPNAGMPKMVDGETVFDITPMEFAEAMGKMAKKGVNILGGCCGTTPEYIKALTQVVEGSKPFKRNPEKITAVSSFSKTVVLGRDITIIGERINPTGKKKLKEALIKGDMDYILKEAMEQKNAGAKILDVNVGLPEIDEKEIMVKVVKELQSIIDVPLQIDSTRGDVIEAAVRIYNGKPMINSVNGKMESMETIFPIAKKYGAVVIALTLDENGIPSTAEERLKVAEKILSYGKKYGVDKKDIIVDCLVLTASAQQQEVKETIKAIKLVKEKLGVKTTLGVSNVSFGLPQREMLNRTFLAAALSAGLDAPIVDPLKEEMKETVDTFHVLWGHDKNAEVYIHHYSQQEKKQEKGREPVERELKGLVIDGMKETAEEKTRQLLREISGLEIVNNHLIPALDVVGNKYEKGEIFLPQLIQSAETVKKAFEVIKHHIVTEDLTEESTKPHKILLATVKGDVHDIGKNIVKILLENYGFDVIDMGKDVGIDEIVKKVMEENIHLIGLSALMTTTVKNMEETIKVLKEKHPSCKVMVGGAVLTKETTKRIGADYYAKDAREGVKIAQKAFQGSSN